MALPTARSRCGNGRSRAGYRSLARYWTVTHRRAGARSLRFVDGRPVSAVTIDFLRWCAGQAAAFGDDRIILLTMVP